MIAEVWMDVLDCVVPTALLTYYYFLRCLKPSLVTQVSPCPTIIGGVGVGEGDRVSFFLDSHSEAFRLCQDWLPVDLRQEGCCTP
eukprot:12894164-Prorocentrum_lima.AAC.1